MFEIEKEFPFEFGHRVWTQKLNKEFSIDDKCKCKHLHGHSGVITVYLQNEKLNNGFVTDFNHLSWFKEFVDKHLDHKFLIDIHDPLFNYLVGSDNLVDVRADWDLNKVLFKRKSRIFTSEEIFIQEFLESFVITDFVPTSENLCAWLYHIVKQRMEEINVNVTKISFKETHKTLATYYSNDKLK